MMVIEQEDNWDAFESSKNTGLFASKEKEEQ